MGNFWEIFVFFPKMFPFFSQKGELFAHFEKKMGKFREKYIIFSKFSRDFTDTTYSLQNSVQFN